LSQIERKGSLQRRNYEWEVISVKCSLVSVRVFIVIFSF
jgi:hypothetical protein